MLKRVFGGGGGGGDGGAERGGGGSALKGRTVSAVRELGPLRVGDLVASGGFAFVYRATRTGEAGPAVALKHVPFARDDEDAAEAARREASLHRRATAAGVPHVARFLGSAVEPACAYHAVALLGEPLNKSLPLQEPAALAAFEDVCAAVAALHALVPPVTHRDIKPENCLKEPDGTGGWSLVDFGSATDRAFSTATVEGVAEVEEDVRRNTTPAFRAPEQWEVFRGGPEVGEKVDVWALGCLLYTLLSGRMPFDGSSKLQVLAARRAPLPEASAPVAALIEAMLTVEPAARPSSSTVLDRVRGIIHGEIDEGPQEPTPQQQQQQQPPTLPPEMPKPPPPDESAREAAGGQADWASFDSPRAAQPSAAEVDLQNRLEKAVALARQYRDERDASRRERDQAVAERDDARARLQVLEVENAKAWRRAEQLEARVAELEGETPRVEPASVCGTDDGADTDTPASFGWVRMEDESRDGMPSASSTAGFDQPDTETDTDRDVPSASRANGFGDDADPFADPFADEPSPFAGRPAQPPPEGTAGGGSLFPDNHARREIPPRARRRRQQRALLDMSQGAISEDDFGEPSGGNSPPSVRADLFASPTGPRQVSRPTHRRTGTDPSFMQTVDFSALANDEDDPFRNVNPFSHEV